MYSREHEGEAIDQSLSQTREQRIQMSFFFITFGRSETEHPHPASTIKVRNQYSIPSGSVASAIYRNACVAKPQPFCLCAEQKVFPKASRSAVAEEDSEVR